MTFHAQKIQEILGITKSRYDYVMAKIGIEPDIERAHGTGKSNVYGFRGLVNFSIASTGIDIGLKPEIIRSLLDRLRNFNGSRYGDFYARGNNMRLLFEYGTYQDGCWCRFYGRVQKDFETPQLDCDTNKKIKIIPIARTVIDLSGVKKEILKKVFLQSF